MMTHGLLWEPQMTCQSSQTGSVSVQTDLALSIHYSECLAKPGSAHPLLITAGRHIRLTPSSVDTHALVHTPRIRAFHCEHTHRALVFIIIFVQPLFVTFTTHTVIAKKITKKQFFWMYTIVVPSFVAFKKVPQQTTYSTQQTTFIVQKICKYVSADASCYIFSAFMHQ